jgi:ATP-dependent DNA helicase PIF1
VLSFQLTVNDSEFVKMLSAMRLGRLNSKTIAKFNQLSRPLVYDDGIEASLL